jgi:hypothetical protein
VSTTLDTFYKTNTNLSGGNLVATSTGAGGARAQRCCSGLTYFEGVITTLTGTPQIGIADSNWDHATGLGTGANTVGYQPSGAVRINNATVSTIAAYVAGNTICVAVDVLNRQIWFRVGSGNWNNSGTANPATGIGGIDFSAAAGCTIGTVFEAISASVTGNVWTMTLSSPFAQTAPTGFASVDTIAYPTLIKAGPDTLTAWTPVVGTITYPKHAGPIDQITTKMWWTPGGAITKVSGTCMESGVTVAGKRVDVYDRVTGELLGTTYSASDGTWSLVCLGRPSVRVVADDPTAYNSLVYDNVVPV